MTWPQIILEAVAAIAALFGVPMLLAPAAVRRGFALEATPQLVYMFRIAGMMLAALGLILASFTTIYWLMTR